MQLSYTKRVIRLPPATDTLTVLAESGRLPMQIKLIESQARYWERIYSLQDFSRILHLAFTEHIELMKKQKNAGVPPLLRLFVKSVTSMDLIPRLLLLLFEQAHNRG